MVGGAIMLFKILGNNLVFFYKLGGIVIVFTMGWDPARSHPIWEGIET